MKRADLKVGEAYLYRRYKGVSGQRATVVDLEKYAESDAWSRGPSYYVSRYGTRVLVNIEGPGISGRHAVPLASLYGPWEETKRAEDEAAEARRVELEHQKREHAKRREVATSVAKWAMELGFTSVRLTGTDDYRLTFSPADADKLLQLWDQEHDL